MVCLPLSKAITGGIMEQKQKIIIIGLAVLSVVCLLLFIQAAAGRQALFRESQDLKTENTTLASKVEQLERNLRENQGKIDSLNAERDKIAQELGELQNKYESAAKARDELMEKLKKQSQRQETAVRIEQPEQSTGNEAYWGSILKAKTDLEMQLSSIRVELRNLQISNESLQREKNALEMDVNNLRNEKSDLTRQLDYNQKLLDSISQEVVREKNDKTAIQMSMKTFKEQNQTLNRQLKSINNRKISLDKKVQDLQDGKTTIEKRLKEMDTMLADKVSQIESLKNQLDSLKGGKSVPVTEKRRESVELPAIVVKSSERQDVNFPGKVLAVNGENNFIVVDLGTVAGISVGDELGVYRSGEKIGAISVIQARDNISACDIKRMTTPIKIGDSVK